MTVAKRRLVELRSGRVKAIPGDEVFAKIRERFEKWPSTSFHPEAKDEFNEAIEYYENCEPCLGYDFSIEVLASIQNIVSYPRP